MYSLRYHDRIPNDIAALPRDAQRRIERAAMEKLRERPDHFGKPLRKPLAGFRTLRIGDYRIVYLVKKSEIFVLLIGHRKHVYELAKKRVLG